MGKEKKTYENYPWHIVAIVNLITFTLYGVGIYLLYVIMPLLALIYIFYLIYLEIQFYKKRCTCCYYYGKTCAFGKGRIAAVLFKKDNDREFSNRQICFKDILPQMFISIIPVVSGIYLLIKDFNWLVVALTVWPFVVMFAGNPVIYGKLACRSCRQGELGCPAQEFFKKKQEV